MKCAPLSAEPLHCGAECSATEQKGIQKLYCLASNHSCAWIPVGKLLTSPRLSFPSCKMGMMPVPSARSCFGDDMSSLTLGRIAGPCWSSLSVSYLVFVLVALSLPLAAAPGGFLSVAALKGPRIASTLWLRPRILRCTVQVRQSPAFPAQHPLGGVPGCPGFQNLPCEWLPHWHSSSLSVYKTQTS